MRYGISTHLFHDQRLSRAHLEQIAARGFTAIELFATRSHFDYHDPAAISALAEWLEDTGLRLNSVHAPIAQSLTGTHWTGPISNAVNDPASRQAAVKETDLALNIVRAIPADVLVVHLGTPTTQGTDNSPASAHRSAEEIARLTEAAGIRLALEVQPNLLSEPAALVRIVEDLDAPHVGICLDFGHMFLIGDVADGIEIVAEHLMATHVHDNLGKKDDHLVPFDGKINWDLSLMTLQKVGYDGLCLLEVANTGSTDAVLDRAREACARFEKLTAY